MSALLLVLAAVIGAAVALAVVAVVQRPRRPAPPERTEGELVWSQSAPLPEGEPVPGFGGLVMRTGTPRPGRLREGETLPR